MRETDLVIKAPQLPNATEVKKLEHKSLVSTIYVGKAKDQVKFGSGDKIQLNDKIASVNDIASFIYSEQEKHNPEEVPYMTTSIKSDVKCRRRNHSRYSDGVERYQCVEGKLFNTKR